jgi:hypothetical protein
MKLLIMKFSPLSCYLVHFRPKYFPQHPVLINWEQKSSLHDIINASVVAGTTWKCSGTALQLIVACFNEKCKCLFMAGQPSVGQDLLIHEFSRLHNDAPQSVGLLWTSDRLVAETST